MTVYGSGKYSQSPVIVHEYTIINVFIPAYPALLMHVHRLSDARP